MSVASPCIGVCALDNDDICIGCFRTADDITEWQLYSEEEQIDCIKESKERAKALGMSL